MNELTETEAKEQGEPPKSARYWHNQIDAAVKREDRWRKRAAEVVCRYMDERGTGDVREESTERRINILWSNTEVLKSVLFSKLGTPDVRRNFPQPGYKNKLARTSALVIERALIASSKRYDIESELQDGVVDYLLTARGQMWLEYEAEIVEDQGVERVKNQLAKAVHVSYDDWTHGPGKKWMQVPWVARVHLFTKDDWKVQFPQVDADKLKIPFNYVLKEGEKRTEDQGASDFRRAKVWEIWDKVSRTRIYIADGYDWEIERTDDPFKLELFFPCPTPLYGIRTPDRLIPQPEYCQYQDQAAELDRINQRIYVLIETMKYCGVSMGDPDGPEGALSRLGSLDDGEFITVKNFQMLAQGGGLKEFFQVRDLAPIAVAVQQLAQRAVTLIQSIYEITGISDVIRGSTDPDETLGAQQLKAKFGSTRMQKRQGEVQHWVASVYKLLGELIAEHYEPAQLSEMTGILLPTEAEKAQAKQLLAMAERMKQMQEAVAQQQQAPQQGMPQPNPMMGHNQGPPLEDMAQQQGGMPMGEMAA